MGIHPLPHLTDASDDLVAGDDGPTRRSFLKTVAIGGAAAAVGGQLLSVTALAQEDAEEVPLTADEERVTFLAGISLAAAAVYKATTGDELAPDDDEDEGDEAAETTTTLPPVTVPPLAEPVVEVLRKLGSEHSGQAAAFSALLAEPVAAPNATLLAQVRSQIGSATDEAAVLGILRDMTEQIAATQLQAIADLEEVNDAKVAAGAVPVMGEHVVVLGQLTTPPVDLASLIPVEQTTDGALTPESYPAEAAEAATASESTTTTDAAATTESEG